MSMQRTRVDCNTLTSERTGLVKYLQDAGQPPLHEGERVVLYDAGGLEGEATIVAYTTAWGEQVWLAPPDEATWHDTVPQEQPLPPVQAR
jgi:hypothetical protein